MFLIVYVVLYNILRYIVSISNITLWEHYNLIQCEINKMTWWMWHMRSVCEKTICIQLHFVVNLVKNIDPHIINITYFALVQAIFIIRSHYHIMLHPKLIILLDWGISSSDLGDAAANCAQLLISSPFSKRGTMPKFMCLCSRQPTHNAWDMRL